MDFDKFIERDIIEFLDNQNIVMAKKAEGLREEEFDLYEINQDYTKEISKALEERDLKKAQQVFEDVKKKYFTSPDGSMSKKRLYIIMEEIYEKIKDFESKEEGKKSLFDTIKDYEEKGLFTKPELFHQKEEAKIHLIMNTISRKEKELEAITKKKGITGKDLEKAITTYRELKKIIRKIPEKYNKDKEKVYDSALGWFYTIKNLKKRLGTQIEINEADQPKKPAKQITQVEEELSKIRKLKEKIVESHAKISEYLHKEDLKNSISEYKNLKNLCEYFPHEMEEEKTALLADALSLYESIKNLKQKFVDKTKQEIDEKQEIKQDQDQRKKIRAEIQSKLEIIKILLNKKDAISAIKQYRELKEIFKQYPDEPIAEKKKFYNEILGEHHDIQLLENDLKKKSPVHNIDQSDHIENILEQTNNLLDKGNVEPATHTLLEAKHKIQMLPKEAFDDKYRFVKDVEKLEHKLLFIKNIHKMNQPEIIQIQDSQKSDTHD